MSLGQCVVQWEGALDVLVSGGHPVYCSVCMGGSQCAVQCGGHSVYVCGGAFSVMLTGLILCKLQAATVTVGW